MGLSSEIDVTGGFLHTSGNLTAQARINNPAGPLVPSGVIQFADGIGAGQGNQVFCAALSIAAGATQQYDLKGGGGELDVLNVALAMAAVKLVYLEVTTPASGTSLQFGPQGVTNAAQLWFQAVTANFWTQVFDKMLFADPRAGWVIGASTKVLAIKNPGASTVAGVLWVIGNK